MAPGHASFCPVQQAINGIAHSANDDDGCHDEVELKQLAPIDDEVAQTFA